MSVYITLIEAICLDFTIVVLLTLKDSNIYIFFHDVDVISFWRDALHSSLMNHC